MTPPKQALDIARARGVSVRRVQWCGGGPWGWAITFGCRITQRERAVLRTCGFKFRGRDWSRFP